MEPKYGPEFFKQAYKESTGKKMPEKGSFIRGLGAPKRELSDNAKALKKSKVEKR